MILLAPASADQTFFQPKIDPCKYAELMAQLQALRGDVYVKGAFLRANELQNGRHRSLVDEASWHLLLLNEGRVCGCIRYRECRSGVNFSHLLLADSALAQCDVWGRRLQRAVQEELDFARNFNLPYVEVGGWALDKSVRNTSDALRMALATYGLSQLLGGAVGISTARQRGSGPVLKKIGGRLLEHQGQRLPAYHDPAYRCTIEILRFYSWSPNPRFGDWIEEVKTELQSAEVITHSREEENLNFRGFLHFPVAFQDQPGQPVPAS